VFAGRESTAPTFQRLQWGAGVSHLLPLYPRAIESLPVQGHDVVIFVQQCLRTRRRPDRVVHICACHSPFRYAWQSAKLALEEAPWPMRPALGRL